MNEDRDRELKEDFSGAEYETLHSIEEILSGMEELPLPEGFDERLSAALKTRKRQDRHRRLRYRLTSVAAVFVIGLFAVAITQEAGLSILPMNMNDSLTRAAEDGESAESVSGAEEETMLQEDAAGIQDSAVSQNLKGIPKNQPSGFGSESEQAIQPAEAEKPESAAYSAFGADTQSEETSISGNADSETGAEVGARKAMTELSKSYEEAYGLLSEELGDSAFEITDYWESPEGIWYFCVSAESGTATYGIQNGEIWKE